MRGDKQFKMRNSQGKKGKFIKLSKRPLDQYMLIIRIQLIIGKSSAVHLRVLASKLSDNRNKSKR